MKVKINETFIFEEKPFFSLSKFWKKKIVTINIDNNSKIYEVKKAILKRYNLNNSIDLFKIVYKNKELNDNLSISELGIKENETLMIFCKNKKELEDILRKKNIL